MNNTAIATSAEPSVPLACTIPRADLPRFAMLLPKARKLVERRLRAMRRIARALAEKRSVRSECLAIASALGRERGWSSQTLQSLWHQFSSTNDWTVLVDASLAGPAWYQTVSQQSLPAPFLDHLCGLWALRQRDKFASVFASLQLQLLRWRAGDQSAAIPGYTYPPADDPRTGLPAGWTYGNLHRAVKPRVTRFARRSIQIGPKSASNLGPLVLTTRRHLLPGQFYVLDDSWNDFKVLAYGQTCRLLAFHVLDLYSACNVIRGYKPALRDRERETEERLREREMIFLLVAFLTRTGYHPNGCTIICEKSTATVRAREEAILHDTLGQAITIRRGPAGGGPGVAALFTGRSGGNPRWKAPLESHFNLLRNRTDNLLEFPGQTGSNSRLNLPEGLPGLERDTQALVKAMRLLPPERAERARLGLLTFVEAIFRLDAVTELINCRIDHDLEGWQDLHVTEWRPNNLAAWRPVDELLEYDPEERAAVAAVLAHDPALKRTRPLSPREVFDAGRSNLTKLPPQVAGLLMEELPGTECFVKNCCLTVEDADVDPEPITYGPVTRDGRGAQDPLRNDDKYLCRLNPVDPSVLWLYDSNNRFVGMAPRYLRAARNDEQALRRAFATKAQALAPLVEETRQLAAQLTRQAAADTRHNLQHVLGPRPGATASLPPAPAPGASEDCTSDLLQRENTAPAEDTW
jgi:hypothetical protein